MASAVLEWPTLATEELNARRLCAAGGAVGEVGRSPRLCVLGALHLVVMTSLLDVLDALVQAGLDWEEHASQPHNEIG